MNWNYMLPSAACYRYVVEVECMFLAIYQEALLTERAASGISLAQVLFISLKCDDYQTTVLLWRHEHLDYKNSNHTKTTPVTQKKASLYQSYFSIPNNQCVHVYRIGRNKIEILLWRNLIYQVKNSLLEHLLSKHPIQLCHFGLLLIISSGVCQGQTFAFSPGPLYN